MEGHSTGVLCFFKTESLCVALASLVYKPRFIVNFFFNRGLIKAYKTHKLEKYVVLGEKNTKTNSV